MQCSTQQIPIGRGAAALDGADTVFASLFSVLRNWTL
jgi:hypothetical protein